MTFLNLPCKLFQLGRSAAVDVYDFRRNEARLLGSKEQHGVGHVLRVARTFEQLPHLEVAREDVLAGGGGETSRENLAGTDTGGVDVAASTETGDVASKTFEAGLCGNIRGRGKNGIPFEHGFAHA